MPSRFPLIQSYGWVFSLDALTLERGIEAAKESPRRRILMQLHRPDTEVVQRMLNFMQRGSHAQPHCHAAPENVETVSVLKSAIGFVVFPADGSGDRGRR